MNCRAGKTAPHLIRGKGVMHIIHAYVCYALFSVMAVLTVCASPEQKAVKEAFASFEGKYVIFVSKPRFMLYVYNREGEAVRSYPIAYGLNPDKKPKRYQGDDRTPEGTYRIVEILSMDADRSSEPYRKLKRMNEIWWRARDGHYKFGKKNEDLGDNAYGPRFYLLDYPNDDDRRRYTDAVAKSQVPMKNEKAVPIGHGIAIHGNNDPDSIGKLATSGCVRMFNNDIIELEKYIVLGTPVIISPH